VEHAAIWHARDCRVIGKSPNVAFRSGESSKPNSLRRPAHVAEIAPVVVAAELAWLRSSHRADKKYPTTVVRIRAWPCLTAVPHELAIPRTIPNFRQMPVRPAAIFLSLKEFKS